MAVLQTEIFNLEAERQRRAQEKAVQQKAAYAFKMHAMKRETNDHNYGNNGESGAA